MADLARLSQLFKEARVEKARAAIEPPETVSGVQKNKKSKSKAKDDAATNEAQVTRTQATGRKLTVSTTKARDQQRPRAPDARDPRTVFIGNLPLAASKKQMLKLFRVYGKVESVRFRSIAVAPGKLPVKVARKLNKQTAGDTKSCYVVFETEEDARKSLELNGHEMEGRHMRVDTATPTKDNKRSIFVGNLPFSVDEEKVRVAFGSCGEIESVRVIRDNRTGIGKGFAYVCFADKSGVLFACKHHEKMEFEGRKLRILKCKERSKMDKQTEYGGIKSKPRFKKINKFKGERNLKRVKDNKHGAKKKVFRGRSKEKNGGSGFKKMHKQK